MTQKTLKITMTETRDAPGICLLEAEKDYTLLEAVALQLCDQGFAVLHEKKSAKATKSQTESTKCGDIEK